MWSGAKLVGVMLAVAFAPAATARAQQGQAAPLRALAECPSAADAALPCIGAQIVNVCGAVVQAADDDCDATIGEALEPAVTRGFDGVLHMRLTGRLAGGQASDREV